MKWVPVAAALFPPTVCALAWVAPPFAGKVRIAAFLVGVVAERTWAMFLQRRDRFSTRVDRDWTAAAVGYAARTGAFLPRMARRMPSPRPRES